MTSTSTPTRARWLRGSDLDAACALLLEGRKGAPEQLLEFEPLLVIVPNAASERSLRERLARGRVLFGVTILTAEQAAEALVGDAPGLRLPRGGERLVAERLLEACAGVGDGEWPRSGGFLATLAGAVRDLLDAGLDAAQLANLRGAAAVDKRLLAAVERAFTLRSELNLLDDTARFVRALEQLREADLAPLYRGRVALVGLYDPTGLQEAFLTALLAGAREPIVCLPGHPASRRFEARLATALRAAGHEIQGGDAELAPATTALERWRQSWMCGVVRATQGAGGEASPQDPADASLRVLGTPGGLIGARLVARHIATALDADPELAPADIEVVSRGTGGVPQGHLVRELLALGVPVRRPGPGTALESRLGDAPLGRALMALGAALAAPKVSRARLLDLASLWPWPTTPVEFAGDPPFTRRVDVHERARWERLSRETGLRTLIDGASSSRDTFRLARAWSARRARADDELAEPAARALVAWVDTVARLHHTVASGRATWSQLGQELVRFVQAFTDPATPGFDAWSARLLSMGRLEVLGAACTSGALGWILEGFGRERLETEGCDPGGVRIGRLGARRGARARLVYLLDGDAGSFPRRRAAAVLLTDSERRALEDDLPAITNATFVEDEERALFQELLELARERLVLVTTSTSIEGPSAAPSPFVLETLGFLAGDRHRQMPDVEALVGDAPPPGFERLAMQMAWSAAAGGEGLAFASRDVALQLVDRARTARAASTEVQGELARAEVLPADLRLAATMERARGLEPGRSAFDGQLTTATLRELGAMGLLRGHAERGVSASTLEAFATCGMRAFLSKLLRVAEDDEPELGRGILHTERGKRVHAILEGFTEAALAAGHGVWSPDNLAVLEPLLEQAIGVELERARRAAPAETQPLWQAEEERYRGLLGVWLRRQVRAVPQTQGVEAWRVASAEWRFEHVRLELAPDESLYLTGVVDRVDVGVGPGDAKHLRIVDYKTGKARGKDDDTKGATALQLFLYGRAARRVRGADVAEGVYDHVFHGERVRWTSAADARAAAEVRALLAVAEAGAFWPSPRKDGKPSDAACTFCDMRVACGPWREAALRHLVDIDPVAAALRELDADDASEGQDQA